MSWKVKTTVTKTGEKTININCKLRTIYKIWLWIKALTRIRVEVSR
jgi:hypothetical protein